MQTKSVISLKYIMQQFKYKISLTCGLVLLENFLLVIIPLLMGKTIDSLLEKNYTDLIYLTLVFTLLIIIAVLRRIYDTRAYGLIRVNLGSKVINNNSQKGISTQNARLSMSRELVDFFEEHLPELITAIITIIVSAIILFSFGSIFGIAALIAIVAMLLIYSLFHKQFFKLNEKFNSQTEKQIDILKQKDHFSLLGHLKVLNKTEIKISDFEAVLYGLIFMLIIAMVIFNLWQSTLLNNITVGAIFSIVTYSWSFAESAIMLPVVLQQWARLAEITHRIN